MLLQKAVVTTERYAPLRPSSKQTEEAFRSLPGGHQDAIKFSRAELLRASGSQDVLPKFIDLKVTDGNSEILAYDIFDLVCLIENDGIILRNNLTVSFVLQSKIGKEQMVINDDQVARRGALHHLRDEAPLELLALRSDTRVPACIDFMPR